MSSVTQFRMFVLSTQGARQCTPFPVQFLFEPAAVDLEPIHSSFYNFGQVFMIVTHLQNLLGWTQQASFAGYSVPGRLTPPQFLQRLRGPRVPRYVMRVAVNTGYHMLHLLTVLDVPNSLHTIVLFVQILKLVQEFLVRLQELSLFNPYLALPLLGHSQQDVVPVCRAGIGHWLGLPVKLLDKKVTLGLEGVLLDSLGSRRSFLLFLHIFQSSKLLFASLLLSLHVLFVGLAPLRVLLCQDVRELIRPCHLVSPGLSYGKSFLVLCDLPSQRLVVVYGFSQERRDSFGPDRVRLCVQLTTFTGRPGIHILRLSLLLTILQA